MSNHNNSEWILIKKKKCDNKSKSSFIKSIEGIMGIQMRER